MQPLQLSRSSQATRILVLVLWCSAVAVQPGNATRPTHIKGSIMTTFLFRAQIRSRSSAAASPSVRTRPRVPGCWCWCLWTSAGACVRCSDRATIYNYCLLAGVRNAQQPSEKQQQPSEQQGGTHAGS